MSQSYDPEELKRLQKMELRMFRDFIRLCEKYDIHYFVIAGTAIGAVRNHRMIPWDDDIDVGMLREDYEKFLKIAPKAFKGRYLVNGPDTPRKYYNLVPNLSIPGTRFIVDLAKDAFEIGIFMDIFVFENIPEDNKGAVKHMKKARFWRDLYILSNIDYLKQMDGRPATTKLRYLLCGGVYYGLKLLKVSPQRIYRHYRRVALQYNGKTDNYTILGDPFAKILCLRKEDIFPLKKIPFEDFEVSIVNDYDKMLRVRFGDYMQVPPVEKRVNHSPAILDLGD